MENLNPTPELYKLRPLELAEYTRLLFNLTHIEANLYLDESKSFKRWHHPCWVILSTGDPYSDEWVAISVDQNPQILYLSEANSSKAPISDSILKQSKEFISKLAPILQDISEEKVDSMVIYDLLKSHDWKMLTSSELLSLYSSMESKYSLSEIDKSYPL